jgi:aminopeptidase-like protein
MALVDLLDILSQWMAWDGLRFRRVNSSTHSASRKNPAKWIVASAFVNNIRWPRKCIPISTFRLP